MSEWLQVIIFALIFLIAWFSILLIIRIIKKYKNWLKDNWLHLILLVVVSINAINNIEFTKYAKEEFSYIEDKLYSIEKNINRKYDMLSEQLEPKKESYSRLDSLWDNNEDNNSSQLKRTQLTVQQNKDIKKEQTVYVTPYGKKYHRLSCQYIKSDYSEYSLSGAKSAGYTACSKCNP